MDKYFTTEWGEKVNLVEHTLEQINKWPNLTISIGTDSQDKSKDKKKTTNFATAVVFRYGNRGAHYVYYEERVPRIPLMWDRLYDEARRTIQAAGIIMDEIPIRIDALEFDYNHIPRFKSNKLVDAVKGWVLGLNLNPVFKSGQMIAAKAADHICRR